MSRGHEPNPGFLLFSGVLPLLHALCPIRHAPCALIKNPMPGFHPYTQENMAVPMISQMMPNNRKV